MERGKTAVSAKGSALRRAEEKARKRREERAERRAAVRRRLLARLGEELAAEDEARVFGGRVADWGALQ
jgi:hypothetical protein